MDEDAKCLLKVLKKVYQKHVLDDPNVGWNELGEDIQMVLVDTMGHEEFNKFVDQFASDKSAAEM